MTSTSHWNFQNWERINSFCLKSPHVGAVRGNEYSTHWPKLGSAPVRDSVALPRAMPVK